MTHGMAEIEIEIEMLKTGVERAEAKAHEFESEAIHNGEIMLSLAAEVAALKAWIDELYATIAKRNKTITEREAEIVECHENYYELEARIAEMEAADQWRPVSEPPGKPGDCLVWVKDDDNTGFHAIVAWANDTEWEDGFVTPLYWRPLPTPPQEAPAA